MSVDGVGLNRLQPIGVEDPRMLPYGDIYPVLKSGKKITHRSYPASGVDNGSITWSIVPPNPNTYVSRGFMIQIPFRVKLVGSNLPSDNMLLNPMRVCVRSNPIQKGLISMNMVLNGDSVQVPIGDMIPALEHYNIDNKLKRIDNSLTATHGSHCQNYKDLYGTNLSPMALASSSPLGSVTAAFPFTSPKPQTNDGTTAVSYLDCVSTEKLYLSPLYVGSFCDEGHAFYGVKNIDIQLNFRSNPAHRFIAIDRDPDGFTALPATLTLTHEFKDFDAAGGAWSYEGCKEPKLLLTYITPQDNDLNAREDKVLSFPYFNSVVHKKTLKSLNAGQGEPGALTDNVISNSYPSRIGIWCPERSSDLFGASGVYKPDAFLKLNSVTFTIGSDTGIFSNATQAQLYKIAVKNGCTLSWWEWSGLKQNKNKGGVNFASSGEQYAGTGSVLMFDGSDYGMELLSAPGKSENTMISAQLNVKNVSSSTRIYDVYTLVVSQGVYQMFEGQVYRKVGVLSSNDIAFARAQPQDKMLNYCDVKQQFGGNFLSGLKDGLMRAVRNPEVLRCAKSLLTGSGAVHRVPLRDR